MVACNAPSIMGAGYKAWIIIFVGTTGNHELNDRVHAIDYTDGHDKT